MLSKDDMKRLHISKNDFVSVRHFGQRNSICIFGILMAVLMLIEPAWATFAVQPMLLDLRLNGGDTIRQELQIQSYDPNGQQTLSLKVVDLTQTEDGAFQIVEPNDPNFATIKPKLSSCRDWIDIGRESIILQPNGMDSLPLSIRVPRGASGFYAAALSVERRIGGEEQIQIIVRAVVPILILMEGRAPRHNVEFTDIGMELRPASSGVAATTMATMSIENNGGTYSTLIGLVRIYSIEKGRQREVTTAKFTGFGIMPGSKFLLKQDTGYSLPSGEYLLDGALYVSNRRVAPIQKKINYAGDPTATKITGDAPLRITPETVTIDAQPGGTRSASIIIQNLSDDIINVKATLGMPSALAQWVVNNQAGEELCCTGWLDVQPNTFTLRPNGRQSVRIISAMPKFEIEHANYYAFMKLHASYDDGQNAGSSVINICANNRRIANAPAAQNEALSPVLDDLNKCLVYARFRNVGNTHFVPKCRVSLRDPLNNNKPYAIELLTDQQQAGSVMIPHEPREFTGIIDISAVPEGTYILMATLQYGPTPEDVVNAEQPVRIGIQNGEKFVATMTTSEFNDTVGITWQ